MITRDASPPTNPMLDWTRKSIAKWAPEHYRDLQGVNWKETSLGDMGSWSGSLRTIVNSIMVHPYQMVLYWGKEYVTIYNTSYADVVRNRHPSLLGQELAKAWPEAYEKIHMYLDDCRRGLSIIRSADAAPVDRSDTDEESYFDWTLTPILEKAGNVGGVLWQQYEGTARILQNRRREMLKTLRASTANSRSPTDFWPAVLEAFDTNTYDSPFVALYQISALNDNEALLIGTRGIPQDYAFPRVVVLAEHEGCFADEIRIARKTGKKTRKDNLQDVEVFRKIAHRGFRKPCKSAVCLPILSKRGIIRTEAFILLGINPKRKLDDDYEIWLDQIQENVTEYLACVRESEEEVRAAMQEQLADVERRRASELSARLKEVKHELRKNELRFTNMANSIPVGLIEMGPRGADSAIFTNPAWHEIMGLSKCDAKSWCEVVHKDDRESVSRALDRAANLKCPISVEYRVADNKMGARDNQKFKWVVSNIVPVFEETGALHGFYSTIADVTPLKLAEEAQKERADEALKRSREQERFIDTVCHELRNPLSAILQYSELILDMLDNYDSRVIEQESPSSNSPVQSVVSVPAIDLDSITESANTIILCTTHQRKIIDDILITSKLDSGLVQVEPIDFKPMTYLEAAISIYKAEAKSKGIELSIEAEKSCKEHNIEWLRGDPSRVMQILLNLVTNAIKFTVRSEVKNIAVKFGVSLTEPESYGKVQFNNHGRSDISNFQGASWGDGEIIYLIITVTDTGIGIPDDVRNTLFRRFQQAPKTESKYGGSGLGLYICKNLTKLLGGSIGVASTEDYGSQFSFYVTTRRGCEKSHEELPSAMAYLTRSSKKTSSAASKSQENPLAKSNPPPHPPVARRSSIVTGFSMLVVEDNIINQKVMKRQLEARGCLVYTACNGLEAVQFIENSSLRKGADPMTAKEIQICFMDCEMPVMNGIEASKKIRAMQAEGLLTRHLPILGVSANVRGPQVQAMKDSGMDDVISKPFTIDELVKAAAELVNSQSVQDWSMNNAISPPKSGTPSSSRNSIVRKGSQNSGESISAASRTSVDAVI
ncbi:hypothetical protein BZA77DRAFT_238992 [Pyronema omphalodes]|nr:hypothetical protein BZA77DRAFT_238992 [Pyronema omphalodes]